MGTVGVRESGRQPRGPKALGYQFNLGELFGQGTWRLLGSSGRHVSQSWDRNGGPRPDD